jgi:hypothetical protein
MQAQAPAEAAGCRKQEEDFPFLICHLSAPVLHPNFAEVHDAK